MRREYEVKGSAGESRMNERECGESSGQMILRTPFFNISGCDDLCPQLQVQCLNERSVMIRAQISPRGSIMMISRAETSQFADRASDISPIL